jgi:sensor histidine kinase YesM
MTNALDVAGSVIDLTASDASRVAVRRAGLALAWLGAWTAVVVMMAGIVSTQKQIPFRYVIDSEAVNYYSLAAVSLVLWFASARMAARRWSLKRQIAGQLALALALIAVWQLTHGAYLRWMIGPSFWDLVYHDTWMFQLFNAVVLYSALVGVTLATQASRRAREHERVQHELALLARDAELRALTAQLEPHFLLNTLNSVMALLEAQPAAARDMLERLAELLKAAFDEMREHDVSLGHELALIDAYLGIEQVRFPDRLQVTTDVPDELCAVRVPPFLLQPIVENAIKHGVAPFSRPGSIVVRARRDGARVRIEISDSGPGFDRSGALVHGGGLSLAERRLQAFAPSGEVLVERNPEGLFTIILAVPA